MDYILHNQKACFTSDGRLEVYDYKLATKLNRHFKKYDNGAYTFKDGEEALFIVPQIEINNILQRFLTKKSTQTTGVATTLQTPYT